MSADYPHRLRITRGTGSPTPGTVDPETGVITPAVGGDSVQVVYDGRADVQDAGESLPRNATGQAVKESDATAFLADEKAGLAIEPNDTAEVFYLDADRTAEGEVKFVRELDGAVLIKYR